MPKRIYIIFSFLLIAKITIAQNWKIGAGFGRAYFHYQYKDYGQGYSNAPRANYGLTAQISLQKELSNRRFFETGLKFVLYEQYYTTRLFGGTWEQNYPVIIIPALFGIKTTNSKVFLSARGGLLLGIMPDQYEAKYAAFYHSNPVTTDSITRGIMKRNFTTFFPLLNIELGIGYNIHPGWQVELKTSGVKGFIRITEYDIYYNDGSGSNDQRAKQWGTGDFAAISLGVKYSLKNKSTPGDK